MIVLTANEIDDLWFGIGMFGQVMFFMRFFIQWLASEKAKRSTIPDLFWYFSIAGGLILFIYAIHKQDPVFILGQGAGVFIYVRNIYLIKSHKARTIQPGVDAAAEEEEIT